MDSTHSRDTGVIESSIITSASQWRNLPLSGIVPHIVQRRSNTPGIRVQDLLHRLDSDGLDLPGPREGRSRTRHSDIDVQIRNGRRDEPGQVRLDPLRRPLESELLGVPRTQDSVFVASVMEH